MLNEARIGYEKYEWSPNADNKAPEIQYFISADNTPNGRGEIIRTGGSPDAQNKKQTGLLLEPSLNPTGWSLEPVTATANKCRPSLYPRRP